MGNVKFVSIVMFRVFDHCT